MEISNKFLAVIVIIAMGMSAISTLTMLSKIYLLRSNQQLAGMATTQQGQVNFTVESNVAIILTNAIIDFGSGYVNTSKPGICQNNATLTAGATYNDTEGDDCWTDATGAEPVSFNIMNDGNRNVQLTVLGPDQRAFLNYSGTYPNNLTWKARNNETGTCVAGANLAQTNFTDFGGVQKVVCSNMSYQPINQDEIAVDIQVVIPSNIQPGKRENTTIEFGASAVD